MTDPPSTPPPASVPVLAVIRGAILAGILVFGGVAWFLHRDAGWRPAPGLDPELLRWVGLAVWGVAALGVLVVRARWSGVEPGRRASLAITGWALGEMAALWGAVYYLLTDDPGRYFTGVIFLLLTFYLFPVPRVRAPGRR